MDLDLKDKHILVTGASGGIGKAIVEGLYEEGANITLHSFTKSHKIVHLIDKFSEPTRLKSVKADLRETEEIIKMYESAIDQFGRIDGLVANAGVWPSEYTLTSDMSLEQWENTLTTNLTGVFLCVKEFFKNLKKHPDSHASIVLIGSTSGMFGEAGHSDYSATKSALMYGLTKTWKNEIINYAKYGRVNTVAPGWTYTPMAKETLKDERMVKKALQTIALRKMASIQDIAGAVLFFLSDKTAGHISGQTLMIDGGMEGRPLYNEEKIDLSFLKKLKSDSSSP